jgi:hypothetical protein
MIRVRLIELLFLFENKSGVTIGYVTIKHDIVDITCLIYVML